MFKKQISTTIGISTIILLAAGVISAVFYFSNIEDEQIEENNNKAGYFHNIQECDDLIKELELYVEDKNYCNNASECQVVSLIGCNFGIAGEDVDMNYFEEIYSEFYSPDGRCWTGEAPECEDPEEGKTIVCENNKCTFKDIKEDNGNVIDCEEYGYDDCPQECYPYMGPSACSYCEICDMDICTEDIMEGCFDREYDPFIN